jgi:predicted secreted hydrolase
MKLPLGIFSFVWAVSAFCGQSLLAREIPTVTAEGFSVPQPNPVFVFPRDHGAHPDFKIEWWYLTGHLYTSEAVPRRFGFQATFFRNAAPRDAAAVRPGTGSNPPAFGHDQIYLAHMALLDAGTGRFLHQERLNRAGWNASAATDTLDVVNGDWSLSFSKSPQPLQTMPKAANQSLIDKKPLTRDGEDAALPLRLIGGIRADARFDFTLTPVKPLVLFGDAGYSRKGSAPTAASYYLTYSRLAAAGTLTLDGVVLPVSGTAWMDHEISSSQLDENQVGWDWLSVQFNDGRELMFYALRNTDGSFDPASTLTWIDRDGKPTRAPYRWEALTRWTSPHTGASYPQRIRLTTTDPANGSERVLLVEPLHPDQELGGTLGGVTYWEGACRILDAGGRELGSAYLELTGYDKAVSVLR